MGQCVRDGFAGQGETSRINKDKTQHLKKWGSSSASIGLMPSPIILQGLHRGGGEPAVLAGQHPATAPTQGNTLKEVRCKCCVLATRQPCRKSGLPVRTGTSSKQLEPKVHMNISSLALIALAIYKVKQSFPPPCDGKGAAVRQHTGQSEGECSIWKQTVSACLTKAHSLHRPQDFYLVIVCSSATRVNAKRGALWESPFHRGSFCI